MADLNNNTFWSEVDASNNSASPNGWPEGMMPSGVNDSARADKGGLKRFWNRINPIHTIAPSGGFWGFSTSNPAAPSGYVDGEIYSFIAQGNSTAGGTFGINALPAKPIYTIQPGSAVAIKAYDIITSRRVFLAYDSALAAGAGGFWLLNPWTGVYGDGALGSTIPFALSVGGNATIGGTLTLSGSGTALSTIGATYVGGQMSADSVYVRNSGATALNTVGGGYIGGQLSADSVYIRTTGGTALNIPNGGITAAGLSTFGGGMNVGGTAAFGTLTASSATIPTLNGNVYIGGQLSADSVLARSASSIAISTTGGVTTGTLTVNSTSSHAGTSFFASAVTINATGTALSVPSGSISAGGSIAAGGALNAASTGLFQGAVTINATGTALAVPNGNITVGGSGTFGGNFQALQGSFIYSGGGYALDISGGSLHVAGSATISGDILCQNVTANVQGYKPAGGSWAAISDVRTKDADSVADYTTGLAAVRQLRPVSYRYNGRVGMPTGRFFVGLVADDVLPVMPEMVGTITERLDPSDPEPTDILTLDATALTYALLNAVKTLAAEIDTLKRTSHAADGPTSQPRPHRRSA